jgi:hypothetical protein
MGASLRDRATLATHQAPAGLGHSEGIPSADFTVEDFSSWARTIRPEKRYDYDDIDGCALCHYFHDRGIGFRGGVGGSFWEDVSGQERSIPDAIAMALLRRPWTYGALAERLSTGDNQ